MGRVVHVSYIGKENISACQWWKLWCLAVISSSLLLFLFLLPNGTLQAARLHVMNPNT